MDFLTETGMSLVDIIDLGDTYYAQVKEKILKQDLADNKPVTEYDEVKDRAFYSPKTFDTALLLEGTFGIMYPEDLHQCVAVNQPMNIRKIVFKIPVGLI